MSKASRWRPSPSKNAIDSGMRVFFIQNAPVVGVGYTNAIPSAGPRSVTPISPRARCSPSSAIHRHSSQTVPSGSVDRAAIDAKPSGTTPAALLVELGVEAVVLVVAVFDVVVNVVLAVVVAAPRVVAVP